MINSISFQNDTHFLIPMSFVGMSSIIAHIFTYPMENIMIKSIAKTVWTFSEIKLYQRFTTAINHTLTTQLLRYYFFQKFCNQYALKLEGNMLKPNTKQYENQPCLNFIDVKSLPVILIASFSNILPILITQPIYIAKIKGLCETTMKTQEVIQSLLEQHQKYTILLKPGLISRITLNSLQFLGEIYLFQQLLLKSGYNFINCPEQATVDKNNRLPLLLAGATSLAISIILQPLNLIHKQYTINSLQGLKYENCLSVLRQTGLFTGFLLNATRNTISGTLSLGILWFGGQRQVNKNPLD